MFALVPMDTLCDFLLVRCPDLANKNIRPPAKFKINNGVLASAIHTKTGTIRRSLTRPQRKDDMQIRETPHFFKKVNNG